MKTEWQQAKVGQAPVVAYLTYTYQMPVFRGEKVIMHQPMLEALPYTDAMLQRRSERGASVPAWWRQIDTFMVGEAA